MVLKIVQDHGGEISVERTPQDKTVFRIILPTRVQQAPQGNSENGADLHSLVTAEAEGASQNSISHPGS